MALTFTTGLTLIDDADDSGSTDFQFFRNSGSGGTGDLAHDTSFFREGTGSWGYRVQQNWESGILFNVFSKAFGGKSANTVWDGTGEHLVFWYNALNVSFLDTDLNDGIFVVTTSDNVTGNSITNFDRWVIGGGPGSTHISYPGGWKLAIIDLDSTPTNSVGTGSTISSLRHVGIGINSITGTVKVENLYLDALWYGTPLYKLTGDGTLTASWQDFIDDSDTNANGLIEDIGGAINLSSGVQFGDAAQSSTTTFLDATGKKLIFKRYTYLSTDKPVQQAWLHDVGNIYFDETPDWNGTGGTTVSLVPGAEAVNDAFYIGSYEEFNQVTVTMSTVGVGGTVAKEFWNGTSWTAVAGLTDNSNNFTATGTRTITYTMPTTWVKTAVNGSEELFYLRFRVTGTYSTNPTLTNGGGGIRGQVEAVDYTNVYKITAAGAAAQRTSITFGQVVGTGDSRQGVLGGILTTSDLNHVTWSVDFATDKTDLSAVKIYGLTFEGAKGGTTFNNNAGATETDIISVNWVNCGEIDPGSTGGGANILNSFVIDPRGDINNYGLNFPQTPSGVPNTLTHNMTNMNFITSGSPTTQFMTRFSAAADYEVAFSNMQFFGDYTSATIQHGRNEGLNADITINATGTSNPLSTRYTNTNLGTVTVATSVGLTVNVVDAANDGINSAQVSIYTNDAAKTQILAPTATTGGGTGTPATVTGTYSGTTPQNVIVFVRKTSAGTTRYFTSSTPAVITTSGLDTTVSLRQDTIASA